MSTPSAATVFATTRWASCPVLARRPGALRNGRRSRTGSSRLGLLTKLRTGRDRCDKKQE